MSPLPTPMPFVGADLEALVLAAGASRRFGSPKQLALIDGVPMLQRVLTNAEAALQTDRSDLEAGSRLTVVLGANAGPIRSGVIERLTFARPKVVVCPDWIGGIAHSLRCGLRSLEDHATTAPPAAVLIILGDTPRVSTTDLQRLIGAWRAMPQVPVAAAYSGTIGAPCILPRPFWVDIMRLEGDRGAGAWLRERLAAGDRITTVDLPQAAIDIDSPP